MRSEKMLGGGIKDGSEIKQIFRPFWFIINGIYFLYQFVFVFNDPKCLILVGYHIFDPFILIFLFNGFKDLSFSRRFCHQTHQSFLFIHSIIVTSDVDFL